MAKEQNLSLNPSKISGNCGRLMCCLKYENDVYEEKAKRLPKVGAIVKTEDGEQLRVKFKDGEVNTYKKYDAKDILVIKDVEEETDETDEIIDPELERD